MTHTDSAIAELERRLKRLEDERDIARLIASYGPLVDAGDADRAANLWTAEGRYDAGDWVMNGRDEIAAMVRSDAHQGLIAQGCCHFFGPPVVTVNGDRAVAVCESTLMVRKPSGGYGIARAGVHLLALRRDQDGWRIAARTARQWDGGGAGGELVTAGLD